MSLPQLEAMPGVASPAPIDARLTSARGNRRRATTPEAAPKPEQGSLWRHSHQARPLYWLMLDWGVAALNTALIYALIVHNNPAFSWVANTWLTFTVYAVCLTFGGAVAGLYERRTLLLTGRTLLRSVLAQLITLAVWYTVIHAALYVAPSRLIGLYLALGQLCLTIPLRWAACRAAAGAPLNVLFIGGAVGARQLAHTLHDAWRGHYRVIGYVSPRQAAAGSAFVDLDDDTLRRTSFDASGDCPSRSRFEPDPPASPGVRRLGGLDEIDHVLDREGVAQVVVDQTISNDREIEAALVTCLERGRRITSETVFAESLLGEAPTHALNTQWFLLADLKLTSGYDAAKRMADVCSACLGLLLTAPLWPLLALLIKLDSPGPVLFQQKRVGQLSKPFTIYKFRTMRQDAERDGAQWARVGDARVTRLGRFLRQSRLDEIPQFWNILRGDMSLVGPRPERPEFVDQLVERIPHYRERHLIKPGLTGWAQINYRYGASVEDAQRKLCFDLYYLKHRSFELDLIIMMRTCGALALGAR